MSNFALRHGRGPVFPDLPPTLQPCAVAASAPPSDAARSALFSGLIYLALAGVTFGFASLAPPLVSRPAPPTQPERIFEFGEPVTARSTVRLALGAGSGGMAAPSAEGVRVASTADPQVPAGTLPTEDHSGDGFVGSGLLPAVPGVASSGSAAAGPAQIHDFSSTGLVALRRVEPAYPDFARRARIQGTVILMMVVDEAGAPIQVQALEGHPLLREAALQAARQWRFEPARVGDRPVQASFRLTLNFRLK
ncbi:energy transducer TonB [Geothrix sp. 21YS21S-4]|uniref:energy transducer TonB n=1 Tax=Geothrix sp. 21YS21S-4 TaxID=3068889 RepID=UPI0027B98228|nr:energy transducer TonB [Geothrix sp. 21YS21S-4]